MTRTPAEHAHELAQQFSHAPADWLAKEIMRVVQAHQHDPISVEAAAYRAALVTTYAGILADRISHTATDIQR